MTLAGKETEENREKYYLDVSDRMVLTGCNDAGSVFGGTRTILQMMEQYDGAGAAGSGCRLAQLS